MQLPDHLFLVIWVAALSSFSLCQDRCQVQDGKPGQLGVPGRDGWQGQKGEKGEPALQVELNKDNIDGLKGDQGERGLIGELGVKGYEGLLGLPGPVGPPGPNGISVGSFEVTEGSKAAFSVVRNKNDKPRSNIPVTFDQEHVNINKDFNLETGYFTCRVPGVYYFVFHAIAEGNLCLILNSDGNSPVDLLFCDYSQHAAQQVVSGGAVLELAKGNKVWLEPWKDEYNKMTTKKELSNVFNGFLIFTKG